MTAVSIMLVVIKKNMKLAEAMNTYNPALSEIKRRGYNIRLELDKSQNEIKCWIAQKQSLEIFSFNPLSLLGLIIIAEQYGNDWNKVHIEDWYDKILENDEI